MKIDAGFALMILRLVLCNPVMLGWLKAESAKSDTPIDDTAVKIVEALLCGSEE